MPTAAWSSTISDGIRLVAVEPPQKTHPSPPCLFHPLQGGTEDGSAGALPVGCHLLAPRHVHQQQLAAGRAFTTA